MLKFFSILIIDIIKLINFAFHLFWAIWLIWSIIENMVLISKIHAIHYEEKKGGRIICVCITLYKKVVGLFFEFTLHSLSMLTIIQIWGYLDTLTIIMERGSKRFIAKALLADIPLLFQFSCLLCLHKQWDSIHVD